MGDMRDQFDDDGLSQWADHCAGRCSDFCPYCEEEAKRKSKKDKKGK